MKKLFSIICLLLISQNCFSQHLYLKITSNTLQETKLIDSVGYKSKHLNIKSIESEIELISAKLSKIGYIGIKIEALQKKNDSSFAASCTLDHKINFITIHIGNNKEFITGLIQQDTLKLSYSQIDNFLNETLQNLEKKGFPFAKIKLANIQRTKNNLTAELHLLLNKQKTINTIVLQEEQDRSKSKFPTGHIVQLNRKFRGRLLNKNTVTEIKNEIDKFNFISIIKPAEILFTNDSTKVYFYIEKRKTNSFDGYIGFTNTDNQKLKLNGYLDLRLENTIKAGEKFALFWKNDGSQQTTFKSNLIIPYLFKSPLGLKAEINILKRDSSFQNTKTGLDLGYFINYNTRVYAGFETTTSSTIQNSSTAPIIDYKNSYVTLDFEYIKKESIENRLQTKTELDFKIGVGNRKSIMAENTLSSKQFYLDLQANQKITINKKNSIEIRNQSFYLEGNNYITNELPFFGGINSIRGFIENSLQGNLFTALLTEYQYNISPSIYIHSMTDFGLLQNKQLTKNSTQLFSFGLGTAVATNNGLLKIALSNGATKQQKLNFYNTILQICYNVKF